jgi:3',5'-cyclic AMP phosphodiesterase CpdA
MRKVLLFIVALTLFVAAVSQPATPISPFFFVQLTDPQFGMAAANAGFAQETASVEFAVATVNRLKPAFVVVTGDLVNTASDTAQIAEYKRVVARIDPGIPVHNVPGNHDVDNEPTPESVEAYVKAFGPDHYTFRVGQMLGIVLNTTLMHSPTKVPAQLAEQENWLEAELAKARPPGVRHVVVFQHHPWFLEDTAEPDGYENIPVVRRQRFLALLKNAGVTHVFAGHTHRNVVAKDGVLEIVASAPIGLPLGPDDSGLRVVAVRDDGIEHRYFQMGRIPNRIDLKAGLLGMK